MCNAIAYSHDIKNYGLDSRSANGCPAALTSISARTVSLAISGDTAIPMLAKSIFGTVVSIRRGFGSNAICSSDCNAMNGDDDDDDCAKFSPDVLVVVFTPTAVAMSISHVTIQTLVTKAAPSANH